jgi:hypothetical protein
MKSFLQSIFLKMSVLIFLGSCANYNYSDEDRAMGFGTVHDKYLEKQSQFDTSKKYNIHEDED